jgi:hypothetical protein
MGKSSLRKGKRAEYYIRDYLRSLLKVEVERVPNSGNHKKFYGDIIVADRFKVEVKYRSREMPFLYPCYDGKLYSFTMKTILQPFQFAVFPSVIHEWKGNCDALVVKFPYKEPIFFADEGFYLFVLALLRKEDESAKET